MLFFIFGIPAIFVILVIASTIHSKPLPSRAINYSPIDRENNPTWCPIHQQSFGMLGTTCPFCDGDYHNDVLKGVYPPGINSSNKQFYFVEDWIVLRKIDLERDRRIKEDKIAPEVAEEEAIKKRDEYIMGTIAHRIAIATGTDLESQKAKIRANAKRLHYAGAAQYSGITIPK